MTVAPTNEVGQPNASVPAALIQFQSLFNELGKGNLNKLATVYSDDIRFQDPLGSVEGLEALTHYFAGAYANVISCHFTFEETVAQGCNATLP